MKRLEVCLSSSDRYHLKQILNASLSVTPAGFEIRARVHRFLQSSTFIEPNAVEPFRSLAESKREQILSELVWRITCHFEGSGTAVLGKTRFDLGEGFAVRAEDGAGGFCVTTAPRS